MVIKGGANLVRRPPAFSDDGKRLLVCTGTVVTVFSVATALPVLQLSGHEDAVTSVTVVPGPRRQGRAVDQVWTSSLDGTIRLWDFEHGILIRTLKVGLPIESMVIPDLLKAPAKPEGKEAANIAFLSVRWNKIPTMGRAEWSGRVVLFNLRSAKMLPGSLAKTLKPRRLIVSPVGSFVGMADVRKIWIWSVPGENTEHVQKVKGCIIHHTKSCSVMAFDPSETVLAGGDETGRILCWYNFGKLTFSINTCKRPYESQGGGVRGNDDAEACTTSHWHANEVGSLLFSIDGTYLFSGGFEGTLVIWQPETGKRQYLPRLGGRLTFITPSTTDPSLFAITCSDNAIRFVNIGTMKVEKACQGIKPRLPFPKVLKSLSNRAVSFDPRQGQLVLPTDNVSLQFYDPFRDRALFEVRVTRRTKVLASANRNSSWSGPSTRFQTFVSHVAFSHDASVMATVDLRLPEERVCGGGSCLKFWDYRPGKQEYLLNTLVNEPHSAEITALVYHPSENMVVSGSLDASFKIWTTSKVVGIRGNTRKIRAWRCQSVGSYRQKKVLSVAFSADGSLLAASTEEIVTLWNPYSNGLVTNLACDPSLESVNLLAFVQNFLVAASDGSRPRLVVWNLRNHSMLWSCDVRVRALSVDPLGSHFGIIASTSAGISLTSAAKRNSTKGGESSRKAVTALFDPKYPTPVAMWTIHEGAGGTLFFGPSNLLPSPVNGKQEVDRLQSCLLVVTGARDYVVFNPYSPDDDIDFGHQNLTDLPDAAPSAYGAIYGKVSTPLKRDLDTVGTRARRPWGDLLNASSHVLPPLNRIGLSFMESFLEKV